MRLISELLREVTRDLRAKPLKSFQMAIIIIAMPIALTYRFVEDRREEKKREANLVYHKQMEALNALPASTLSTWNPRSLKYSFSRALITC